MQVVNFKFPERKLELHMTPRSYNFMKVKQIITKDNINLAKRFPIGLINNISKKLNIVKTDVYSFIDTIRKQNGITVNSDNQYNSFKEILEGSRSSINYLTLSDKQYRKSPWLERVSCDKLIYALTNLLPSGGAALVLGTPSPFSACPGSYRYLCLDNLEVMSVVKLTTQVPGTIIVGNAIDEQKAFLKAYEWKSNNITYKFRVFVGLVDRHTLYHQGVLLAEKYKLAKLILMTSGVWEDSIKTREKRKINYPHLPEFDFNFKDSCYRLVERFNNLHILAMVKGSHNGPHQIGIKYLHNKTIQDVELPPEVDEKLILK